MRPMDNVLHKLKITGSNIIDYNSFGILVNDGNNDRSLWVKNENGVFKQIKYKDCTVRMNNHFIIVRDRYTYTISGVYVEKSDGNVIDKLKIIDNPIRNIYIDCKLFEFSYGYFRYSPWKVVIAIGDHEIFLVNYQGKVTQIMGIVDSLNIIHDKVVETGFLRHINLNGDYYFDLLNINKSKDYIRITLNNELEGIKAMEKTRWNI